LLLRGGMSRAFTRVAAGLAAFLCWAGLAQANGQHAYVGVHPLSSAPDDGFCYIEAPHVHAAAPSSPALYVDRDEHHHFIGDPMAFGYDGEPYPYQGHHPIAVDVVLHGDDPGAGDVLCVIDGPHYHYFEPAARLDFELRGGAYVFVGEPPGRAIRPTRQEVALVNAAYADIEYARPIVDVRVAAPVTFVAAPVAVEVESRPIRSARPVARGRAEVRAGVEVHVPVPSLELRVGGPGVVVHERGPRRRYVKHKKHKRYRYDKRRRYKQKRYKHKKYKRKRKRARKRYYRPDRRRVFTRDHRRR